MPSRLERVLTFRQGAASDKVAALEKAGVIVTDSPSRIGTSLLEVSLVRSFTGPDLLTCYTGDESRRTSLDAVNLEILSLVYIIR